VATELNKALDVLNEQVKEQKRVTAALEAGGENTSYIAEQTERLQDALEDSGLSLDQFLATLGMTRAEYDRILADTQATNAALAAQGKLQQGIAGAMKTAAGGDPMGGATQFMEAITSVFSDNLDKVFDDAAKTISNSIMKGIGSLGLDASSPLVAGVGAGIGTAAIGAMQGNMQMVGSGIGQAAGMAVGTFAAPAIAGAVTGAFGAAAGAAIGSIVPVVGTVIGAVIGGFASKLFGGGGGWKSAKVTAFQGTTYETTEKVRYNTENKDASPVARAAVEATQTLLKNFNDELVEYVENIGGTVKKGTKLVVDQSAAVKAITGYKGDFDAPRSGKNVEKEAERIAAKVAEVMSLAAMLVATTVPPLTQAQAAWREAQAAFTTENRAILKALGFSAKQINDALGEIKKQIATTMEFDLINMIIDSGHATKKEIDRWKKLSIDNLKAWYRQQMEAAKELGVSTEVVTAAYRAGLASINDEYADMLEDMGDATDEAAEKLAKYMDKLAFAIEILSGLNTINNGAAMTRESIKYENALLKKDLEARRVEAVKQAKELGIDVYWVNQYYNQQLIELEKETAAQRLALARQGTNFNLDMINIIIGGGKGTKSIFDQWLSITKLNLGDWLNTNLALAKEMGGDTKLVYAAYFAQIADATKQYNEWMAGLVGTVITWREKANFTIGILEELNQINDGGNASAKSIKAQYDLTLKINADNRKAAVAEAVRLGQDVAWVNALYDAKDLEALKVFNDQMHDLLTSGLDDVITAISDKLSELQDKLNGLISERNDVLQELTRRSEEARSAELALADARKNLAGSTLATGGPLDQLAELQRQFGSAVSLAGSGDAASAQQAADLAQSILQLGQSIYGSGADYADLFRMINTSLTDAQTGAGTAAEAIETQLDKETFSDLTRESTEALLKALGTLNASIKDVSASIADQTKKLAEAEAKRKVAA
jgi:hypothetical protein